LIQNIRELFPYTIYTTLSIKKTFMIILYSYKNFNSTIGDNIKSKGLRFVFIAMLYELILSYMYMGANKY